jgi:hypothetical protein
MNIAIPGGYKIRVALATTVGTGWWISAVARKY